MPTSTLISTERMRIAIFASVFFLVLYGLLLFLLSALNRPWWNRRRVRRALFSTPVAALLFGVFWAAGSWLELPWLSRVGAGLLSALYIYLGGLVVALAITGLAHTLTNIYDRLNRRRASSTPPSPERRLFLQRALAGVPLAMTGVATGGILHSAIAPRMPHVPLRYPHLPARLEGLRILHLTDIHIGPYIQLDDLERLVARSVTLSPDLVLLTGDLCDHLPSYRDTLRIIEQLEPRLGIYASLGNHEYFRGIRQIRRIFSRSPIPLLINQGIVVDADGCPLFIGGADDPRFLHTPESYRHLRSFTEKALEEAPTDAFKMLLSHRSQAFDYAAPFAADLTLSGHTHGFQIGFGGRSLFESLMPERYIWGLYRKEGSQLYTSAGVGHWFPFRLGCPPEAPLYILHRTDTPS